MYSSCWIRSFIPLIQNYSINMIKLGYISIGLTYTFSSFIKTAPVVISFPAVSIYIQHTFIKSWELIARKTRETKKTEAGQPHLIIRCAIRHFDLSSCGYFAFPEICLAIVFEHSY